MPTDLTAVQEALGKATPGEFVACMRKDESVYVSAGDHMRGPHAQGDVHLPYEDVAAMVAAISFLRSPEFASLVRDSERLDALEREIQEGGPIVLHNGEGTKGAHRGLGMASTNRTLRQAIDQCCGLDAARAAQQPEGQ